MTSAYHRTLLLLLWIIISTLGGLTDGEQVVRQNIGVIYEQLPGQIITGHDNHQIILAIPYTLPQTPMPKPPIKDIIRQLQTPMLGPSDSPDARLLQQAADLDKLVDSIDQNIRLTIKNIILISI